MWKLNINFSYGVGKYYTALYLPTAEYVCLPNGIIVKAFSPETLFAYIKRDYNWKYPMSDADKRIGYIEPILKEHFRFERLDKYEQS